jgi:hypothetical protein
MTGEPFMQPKKLVFATIPMLSLALASFGGATTTIHAFLSADGVAQNTSVFDCSLVSSGKRGHIQAEARGLDSCGNPTTGIGTFPTPRVATSTTGTTASASFDPGAATAACGITTQHRAMVQSHLIDVNIGKEFLVDHPPAGPNSGCWNSNVNTGACTSQTPPITLSSSLTQSGGSCQNRTFRAVSTGTTSP